MGGLSVLHDSGGLKLNIGIVCCTPRITFRLLSFEIFLCIGILSLQNRFMNAHVNLIGMPGVLDSFSSFSILNKSPCFQNHVIESGCLEIYFQK